MQRKFTLASALLLTVPALAIAQVPSAGSQIQQIPTIPSPLKEPPRIAVPQTSPAESESADSVRIVVNRLSLTGVTRFTQAELLDLVAFVPGKEMSLSELRKMSATIAAYYRDQGYFLARAFLPVQDIKNGEVTIAVVEGRYGKIALKNESLAKDSVANDILAGMNRNDLISNAPLERRLLLLSDLPAVNVSSTLMSGADIGEADLLVTMTPAQRVTGSIDADNAGNRYTGTNRLGATLIFNEPTGQGDQASLRLLTSGKGLNYARAAYQLQFGAAHFGASYSALDYALGENFESLNMHGTTRIASVFASYPLIRSRKTNLNAQLVLEDRRMHDRIDATATDSDKQASVLQASLFADRQDSFGGGGLNTFSLTLANGDLDLKTPSNRIADSLTAKTQGHYQKLSMSASRLQNLTDNVSLYAAVSGQFAGKNLDVSEKMELGGMYGVRAYPEGETYADQGYLMKLEARWRLDRFWTSQTSKMQLIGFVDTGKVSINSDPWTTGQNQRRLSAVGVGWNWAANNNFSVTAYYARKLGNEIATSAPDTSGRFWLQAVKYF